MGEYHPHLEMLGRRIDDGSVRQVSAGRILVRNPIGVGPDGRTPIAITIAGAGHDVEDLSTEVPLELPEARGPLRT